MNTIHVMYTHTGYPVQKKREYTYIDLSFQNENKVKV